MGGGSFDYDLRFVGSLRRAEPRASNAVITDQGISWWTAF